MNERIQKLLEQSGLQAYYEAQEGQIEKFAELIVKECASLAYDGPGGILDHFGLEEDFGVEMNQRMIDIAIEANGQTGNEFDLNHEPLDAFLTKFAELIVRECGVALNPMLRDMVSRGQAYNLIKQHFGVEE
jgi:hypothetical protein